MHLHISGLWYTLCTHHSLAKPQANTSNAFRNALRSLSSEDDFAVIFDGLCRLLNNPHQANNTLLPSSMKQISCFQVGFFLSSRCFACLSFSVCYTTSSPLLPGRSVQLVLSLFSPLFLSRSLPPSRSIYRSRARSLSRTLSLRTAPGSLRRRRNADCCS